MRRRWGWICRSDFQLILDQYTVGVDNVQVAPQEVEVNYLVGQIDSGSRTDDLVISSSDGTRLRITGTQLLCGMNLLLCWPRWNRITLRWVSVPRRGIAALSYPAGCRSG